jgi:hypothetical protein
LVPRAAGAREPAERGGDEVTLGAQRRQIGGRRRVRRRVIYAPVVCFNGGLLAAQLAEVARPGESLLACVQVDRVLVVEPGMR